MKVAAGRDPPSLVLVYPSAIPAERGGKKNDDCAQVVEHTFWRRGNTCSIRVAITNRPMPSHLQLSGTQSVANWTALSSFNYAYNRAGQRSSVTNVHGAYWAYGYDSLGQIVSGRKYWSDGSEKKGGNP